MSNYPNMSYCMYENTVHAMNQICNDLSDAEANYVSLNDYRKQRSSMHEAQAFDRIKYMCEDMLRLLENISQYVDEDDAVDQGDDDNEFIVEDDEMIPVRN